MIIEAVIIGVCVFIGGAMIGAGLLEINQTLQRILKRWAAFENLGIFPGVDDDPGSVVT